MSKVDFKVDTKEVTEIFSSLTSREQKRSYKNALRKGAGILARATRLNLRKQFGIAVSRSKNKWNGKTLESGVGVKAENSERVQVNIMRDFRLKFFEKSTKIRKTEKGYNRGAIKGVYFFKAAKDSTENQIFSNIDTYVSESIQRTFRKKK